MIDRAEQRTFPRVNDALGYRCSHVVSIVESVVAAMAFVGSFGVTESVEHEQEADR